MHYWKSDIIHEVHGIGPHLNVIQIAVTSQQKQITFWMRRTIKIKFQEMSLLVTKATIKPIPDVSYKCVKTLKVIRNVLQQLIFLLIW